MGFSSFRLNVVLRALALALLSLALAWGLTNTAWLITPVVCSALLALVTFDLIRYVERSSHDLSVFLRVIVHHDFSTPLSNPAKGRVFRELQDAYRVVTGELRWLSQQKAAHHRYLEAVVEHVGVALCCLDAQGMVNMMNQPARRLFAVPYLHSLRSFDRIDERLPELLRQLGDGERRLLEVRRGDDILQLVLYATTFELLGQHYKLVSFQNIRDELDRRETDSWQKLISVLTHEIMNSVTPIISLSGLIRDTMIHDGSSPPAFRALLPQEHHDMLRSVTAIHARSSGLLDFVQAYRRFSKLPAPSFADVNVLSLLERARTLMSQEADSQQIEVEIRCEHPDLSICADALQIEQVLINLLRNAVEALSGNPAPRIALRGLRNEQGEVLLQVADKGPGIAAEHLDSIFIPFFTTKRSGTGVGLSISRQIVQANRGSISVRSRPGEGSVFTLKFAVR
jgi:signal transduction histidine kinase